jgi:RNA recognition motif-containing protein
MVQTVVAGGQGEYRLVYLSGLPRPMTAADLNALCVPFGQVVDVYIERDPYTGAQWGFGFVEFGASEAAERAARELHGRRYRGDVLTARQVSGALSNR